MSQNPLLRWFATDHLRDDLKPVVVAYRELAVMLCSTTNPGAEQTVALRKLLESKDAAVRAVIMTGEFTR